MAKYEEKFIVINTKHLNNIPKTRREKFLKELDAIQEWLPNNKYYVCNQDEPYAKKVIKTILDGENKKKEIPLSKRQKEVFRQKYWES